MHFLSWYCLPEYDYISGRKKKEKKAGYVINAFDSSIANQSVMCCKCVVYFCVAAPVSSVLTTEGGVFLCSSDCKEKEVAEQAKDDAAAKRLWAISEKWTRLT